MTSSLRDIFSRKDLQGESKISDKTLSDIIKSVQKSLLNADVGAKLVKQLGDRLRSRIEVSYLTSGTDGMNKGFGSLVDLTDKFKSEIVKKEIINALIDLLDGTSGTSGKTTTLTMTGRVESKSVTKDFLSTITTTSSGDRRPRKVVFVGINGNGKTTSLMRYGYYYQKKGHKVSAICCDTFRAGAFDQFRQNCTTAMIPYYGSHIETDPEVVARQGMDLFDADSKDGANGKVPMILIDTTGRVAQDAEMDKELKGILEIVKPDEVLLVLSSDLGQAAEKQAQYFAQFGVTGIILTKTDGSSKGGGALAAVAATGAKVKFIGTGEMKEDFQEFSAQSYVSRLLGMGDIGSLFKKLNDAAEQRRIKGASDGDLSTSLISGEGKFTFRHFIEQVETIVTMMDSSGSDSILSMIPGVEQLLSEAGNLTSAGTEGDQSTFPKELTRDNAWFPPQSEGVCGGKETKSEKRSTKTTKRSTKPTTKDIEKMLIDQFKDAIIISGSFTMEEMDNDDKLLRKTPNLLNRIARGSGKSLKKINQMLQMFTFLKKSIMKLKGGKGGAGGKAAKGIKAMLEDSDFENMSDEKKMKTMMGAMGGMMPKGMSKMLGGTMSRFK